MFKLTLTLLIGSITIFAKNVFIYIINSFIVENVRDVSYPCSPCREWIMYVLCKTFLIVKLNYSLHTVLYISAPYYMRTMLTYIFSVCKNSNLPSKRFTVEKLWQFGNRTYSNMIIEHTQDLNWSNKFTAWKWYVQVFVANDVSENSWGKKSWFTV